MLDSAVLEVLIGLVLVYLLFSLVSSAIAEAVASGRRSRARALKSSIARLLDRTPEVESGEGRLAGAFFAHPLIRGLCKDDRSSPSYISQQTFAAVLLDLLAPAPKPGAAPDRADALVEALAKEPPDFHPELQRSLQILLAESSAGAVAADAAAPPQGTKVDLEDFRRRIEAWFNEAMDRTSGWYKRRAQWTILGLALALSVVFNVDSIALVTDLYQNPAKRQILAAKAEEFVAEAPGQPENAQERARALLAAAGEARLPLGWTQAPADTAAWLQKLIGLALSAVAISLGAPFWFDVLNKLVSLRSAGKKPESAEKPPVAPAAQPASPAAASPPASIPSSTASKEKDMSPFDPHAAGYRDHNALFLARLARLAYEDFERARSELQQRWSLDEFQAFDRAGTQAFLAASGQAVVIAFRGTEPKQLDDILTDAKFQLEAGPFGKVHAGFKVGLERVLADVLAALKPHREARKPLWLTGHSLGAALATLLAAELQKKRFPVQGLYTFGSPRVGDGEFAAALQAKLPERIHRFVNHEDLVTRVPPRKLGYEHAGTLRHFDDAGVLTIEPAAWVRFLNSVLNAVEDFKKAALSTVKDHSMDLYLAKLENWVTREA
jgi:triacylglycerol lipase